MRDDKKLQVTLTGEPVQPIRLYYQLVDKKRFVGCLKKLRCTDFDPAKNRWVWLYEHEAKSLKFENSYSAIPKRMHPVVIGSFFLKESEEF
ncbi:MAG: hypothetical protein AMJ79_12470 [Phycisphaerae bacterium SM23_30]|nr:MAG: hypothetical protein AMJ79_12470 [Phycisphaerae bacterium SM23_30]